MTDCPNVEMRDRLPDLANDTLGAAERDLVLIHLGECAACTAEIEILRTTRLILVTTTPKVNVAGIVMALPQYGLRSISDAPTARRNGWANSWRAAAAVAFLAAGVGSYAMISSDSPVRPQDSITDIETIEALPSTEVEVPGSGVNVPTILPDSMVRELEVR
jgi:hypothetical protein